MLTRRRLVQIGFLAWAGTMLGAPRLAREASASAADVTAPATLRRATWAPLAGAAIAVGGAMLKLDAVGDLPHLAGRDDAYRLELSGRDGAVPAGIQSFRHPAFGATELFVAPVDVVVGGVAHYEVVVDRSVGVPHTVPAAPSTTPAPVTAPSPAPAAAPAVAPKKAAAHHRRHRRHLARRARRPVRTRWLARRIS
jgi:hypothetical protein